MARKPLHLFPWRNTSSLVRSFVVAALLCLGAALLAAPPASAHDQLISSYPSEGQRLSVAPSTINLTFSAQLLTLGHEVRIVDADSKDWAQGTVALTLDSLSQPLTADMPEGEYKVRWRVVSSDGHPLSGAYSFFVGENAQVDSIPLVTTPESAPSQDPASAAAPSARLSLPAWGVPALFGAGAGLILYLAYIFVSSVRRRSSAGRD